MLFHASFPVKFPLSTDTEDVWMKTWSNILHPLSFYYFFLNLWIYLDLLITFCFHFPIFLCLHKLCSIQCHLLVLMTHKDWLWIKYLDWKFTEHSFLCIRFFYATTSAITAFVDIRFLACVPSSIHLPCNLYYSRYVFMYS